MTPLDFGPIYAETDMARFPVEPWNTVSNLIFLLIIIYFSIKTRFNWKTQPLLVGTLPVLSIGFVGGTLYHATRSSNFYLYLDFLPIFFLALAASLYFWFEFYASLRWAIVTELAILVTLIGARDAFTLSHSAGISLGYVLLVGLIFLPAILLARQNSWKGISLLIFSLGAIAAGITFRTLDGPQILQYFPMGTHFLWHILGGVASFFLMEYIYKYSDRTKPYTNTSPR